MGLNERSILVVVLLGVVACGGSSPNAEAPVASAASSGDEESCEGASACDHDADGVFDSMDECPYESEDMDGYRDNDGCPEPDREIDRTIPVAPH